MGAVGDGIDFDEENGLVQPAQTGLVDVSFKVNNVGRWLRSTQVDLVLSSLILI